MRWTEDIKNDVVNDQSDVSDFIQKLNDLLL